MGLLPTACQRPTLMPPAPLSNHSLADGSTVRAYDRSGDGFPDYVEHIPNGGRMTAIELDTDLDGLIDAEVDLGQLEVADCRQLLIILDSIPFDLVHDAWERGHFRLFHPPSRIISPFPVMTDLSLNEFFGKSPSCGMESTYFDGRRRTNGYLVYFKQGNAPWMKSIDAKIDPLDHGAVYLWPHSAVLRELARTERLFFEDDSPALVSYSVGTSAGGSREGANGHVRNLMLVERFCQAVMQRAGGKVQITLMSDHGHNLVKSDYFPLHKKLEKMGYRDRRSLSGVNDIVVPRFGPITCAGIYTRSPQRVAQDVIRLEEIELSCYRENNAVVVLGKHGRARITRQGRRFRYDCDSGDPLELLPALERLRARGLVDDAGYADDSVLFEETCHLPYPDSLHRLWRAFDGLMRHPPDVIVSIRDGSCYGTSFFNLWVRMKSAHGNLRLPGSSGFVMTTAAQLPEVVRMEDLAEQLRAVGWEDVRAHGAVH